MTSPPARLVDDEEEVPFYISERLYRLAYAGAPMRLQHETLSDAEAVQKYQFIQVGYMMCTQWRHTRVDASQIIGGSTVCTCICLFRLITTKTWMFSIFGPCEGNPSVTDGFPAQKTVMQKTYLCHDVKMRHQIPVSPTRAGTKPCIGAPFTNMD